MHREVFLNDSRASNVRRSAPSTPPSGPEREALRARIDAELAHMESLTVSSWMLARERGNSTLPGVPRPASEINVDVALAPVLTMARRSLTPGHSAHVTGGDGVLLAIYRPDDGSVHVRDTVDTRELLRLAWRPRPLRAAQPPEGWRSTSFEAVQWRFSLLGPAGDQALSRHWRDSPLRLREIPPFNFSLLPGRQFEIISALQKGDRSLAELVRTVGGDEAQLSRELVALMLMGCLVIV